MAVGFSGSNGGISEAYRNFAISDIGAGLRKYEELYISAPNEEAKELYEHIVESLTNLHEKIASKLENKL